LNTNLRELYISDDIRAHKDYPFAEDLNYGSDFDFAMKLCVNSKIAYLVVFDSYFRVVRGGGNDIQLEYVDVRSSEAEEAEIFMLYRERTAV
jgi:hypothetical protein